VRFLDVIMQTQRAERAEAERDRGVLQLSRERERARRLLADNGRYRRMLVDAGIDPDSGGPAEPDDHLLRRAFGGQQ
jgi:hypothetical protein